MSKAPLPIICLIAVLSAPGSASAALPSFDGAMSFPAIQSPSDPEEYSWEVDLGPEQYLEQIDDQHAQVRYEGGQDGFKIDAVAAHDAYGSNVPTTISITQPNVVTLIVHHRAGNPAAGGASFVYPIVGGVGWEGGFQTYIIQLPPGTTPVSGEACRVPKLSGRTLANAKRRLTQAGCKIARINSVHRSASKIGRVVDQNPKPGIVLAPGVPVHMTVGT